MHPCDRKMLRNTEIDRLLDSLTRSVEKIETRACEKINKKMSHMLGPAVKIVTNPYGFPSDSSRGLTEAEREVFFRSATNNLAHEVAGAIVEKPTAVAVKERRTYKFVCRYWMLWPDGDIQYCIRTAKSITDRRGWKTIDPKTQTWDSKERCWADSQDCLASCFVNRAELEEKK